MGVDETRENGLSAEINLLAEAGCKAEDFIIGTDCEDPATADRQRLRTRHLVIHGPHVAVVKDEIGFDAGEGKQRECPHAV